MSTKIVTLLMAPCKGFFSSPEKFLLISLANFYNEKNGGRLFPSIETLSKTTELCRRAVINNLKSLANKKVLFIDGRLKKGRTYSNNYYFNMPLLEKIFNRPIFNHPVDNLSTERGVGVHLMHGGGVLNANLKVHEMHPNHDHDLLTHKSYENDFEKMIFSELERLRVYPTTIKSWIVKYGFEKVVSKFEELKQLMTIKKENYYKNPGAYLKKMIEIGFNPSKTVTRTFFEASPLPSYPKEKRTTPQTFLDVLKKSVSEAVLTYSCA